MTHFLAIADFSPDQLRHFLAVAKRLKHEYKTTGRNAPLLAGKTLALVFEKPSLRTRVSFSVGMTHLGGTGMYLSREEVGIGTREPVQDVARVLSGMCDGIMARVFEHDKILGLARHASVPVINGLSDYNHPCQAMADLLTLQEHFGDDLKGKHVAFVGDANNVSRSLAVIAGKFGMSFTLAAPQGYEFSKDAAEELLRLSPGLKFDTLRDPAAAVRNADVVVTDTWVSMGQEAEKAQRLKDFAGFQVDDRLLAHAPKHAVVLHCLPAYRGYEISESVLESPRSLVFPEAENRLHAQKGILAVLLAGQ